MAVGVPIFTSEPSPCFKTPQLLVRQELNRCKLQLGVLKAAKAGASFSINITALQTVLVQQLPPKQLSHLRSTDENFRERGGADSRQQESPQPSPGKSSLPVNQRPYKVDPRRDVKYYT